MCKHSEALILSCLQGGQVRICSEKQSLFDTVVKAQKTKEHQQPQCTSMCGNYNKISAMLEFCAQANKNF